MSRRRMLPLLLILCALACRKAAEAPPAPREPEAYPSLPAECAPLTEALSGIPGDHSRELGAFDDPVAGRKRWGCRLSSKGGLGALRGAREPADTPEEPVVRILTERGFQRDPRYDADGPGGTAFALRKDAVLCLVRVARDGAGGFELSVDCASEGPEGR